MVKREARDISPTTRASWAGMHKRWTCNGRDSADAAAGPGRGRGRGRLHSLEDDALIFLLDDRWLQCSHDRLRKTTTIVSAAPRQSRTTARTSSKTFFNPFCVRAEHSTYFTAPSSLASRSPCSEVTGRCFCLASFSSTCGSSRRSIWVPTMRQGTPGQWWCTSGNHFSLTFSNDAGDVTLKQTRNTSVWGYDSGLSRS